MEWIERDQVGLRYDVSGSGPTTLVLVHEMGGTLESWDDVLPRLEGTTVLRYDTRGAGQSTKLRGTARPEDMVADIAGLLEATERSGPVVIAGIAVGGAIALRFAADHADRVAGVVAFGPATGVPQERRATALAYADEIEQGGMAPVADASFERAYPEVLRALDRRRYERFRARWLANDPGSYAAIYRMLAGFDMAGHLALIRCPALLLAGIHDPLRPPQTVEPVARLIPNARFETLETGHYASTQTPDRVADVLNGFLAALGSDRPRRMTP